MEPNAQQYVRTAIIGGANAAHPFRRSLAGIAVGVADRIYALGDGEVRTFEPDGTFLRGYKVVENATCLAAAPDGGAPCSSAPPVAWSSMTPTEDTQEVSQSAKRTSLPPSRK